MSRTLIEQYSYCTELVTSRRKLKLAPLPPAYSRIPDSATVLSTVNFRVLFTLNSTRTTL